MGLIPLDRFTYKHPLSILFEKLRNYIKILVGQAVLVLLIKTVFECHFFFSLDNLLQDSHKFFQKRVLIILR